MSKFPLFVEGWIAKGENVHMFPVGILYNLSYEEEHGRKVANSDQ